MFFVLGDINIHFSSKSSYSAKAREYLNMLNANCSTFIINIPTKITSSSATVLDHIITNENRYEILPFVVNYNITDHFPIIATIKNNFISQRHQQRLVRSFSKFNSEHFNDDLFFKIKNFVPKFNTATGKNITDLFEQFYSLITKTIDTHAPFKKLSRK